jgi:GDP-L-fucose synthase
MKKLLITGASGFVGRNLQESYLKDKYEITAIDYKYLDLSDTSAVDAWFKDKYFDGVINCALKPGHRNAGDTSDFLAVNFRMFENLARHADKMGRFINMGSGSVYGQDINLSGVGEDFLFQHLGPSELSLYKYTVAKRAESIPNFIDFFVFGIFGKYEDYAIRFISNAICKTIFDLPITCRQNRLFSYLDVADIAQFFDYFIENEPKHKAYNIVPDRVYGLVELAHMIKEISGKDIPIKVASEGNGLDYYGSNIRLKSEIGTVNFTSMEDSIKKLFAYYESQKDKLNCEVLIEDK